MLTGVRLLLLFITLQFLTGCIEEEDRQAINDAFNPPVVGEPLPDDRIDTRMCKTDKYNQPEAEIVRKIDILFVVDTSGSLREERGEIADGIDAFVQELPLTVDFQIGVMLAHGDNSPHSGRLYSKGSNPNVLNSQDLSMDEIRSYLRENMTRVVSDNETDYGEAGTYSLSRALTDQLPWNRDQGFFRDDSALAVVFVSDENDICSWNNPPAGIDLLNDPDRLEIPAANKYCGGLTTEAVYEIIKTHQQDRPTIVSGIVYTNADTVPRRGENEVGYGYVELIEKSKGLAIDMANGDYELGMSEIGFLATKKLNLLTDFGLSETRIDMRTLKVEVDRQQVPHTYIEETNEVTIAIEDAGREYSEVTVSYCQPILEDPIVISNVEFSEATHTTVMVTWRTALRATSLVQFKDKVTGEVLESMHIKFLETYHSIDMSGLKADTEYEVTVISTIPTNLGTEEDRQTASFKTPQ